ncbi:MAG: amino acid ABC transporter permease [Actinobacteria bacterium]|nr:amino acid ABC transporter permease [Actinomycetota bacterium]
MTEFHPTTERIATDLPPGGQRPPASHGPVVVPQRHPWRWVAAAFVLFLASVGVYILVTNPNFNWPVVWEYLFSEKILAGVVVTLELTAIAMVIGCLIGMLLAGMRLSPNPIVARGAALYIWFFRGTPILVQLIFWYNLAALFPNISLGVPFGGEAFVSVSANTLIKPFTAAVLGLGLNEGAYMAEIVRAGMNSVDEGQVEAGRALGLRRLQIMRRIVMPQAMRFIIPPTGNETIGMLKTTALVSVIALSDILYSAQQIYAQNFETIPLLIVASLWYLAITSVLTLFQGRIEARFNRGAVSAFYGGAAASSSTKRRTLRGLFELRGGAGEDDK